MTYTRKILLSLYSWGVMFALHGISNVGFSEEHREPESYVSARQASSTNSTNSSAAAPSANASLSWTLHDWISGTAELGLGWRLDGVKYDGNVTGNTAPYNFRISDTANLIQLNFRGDATAFKYLYFRTDLGYGFVITDHTHFEQKIADVSMASSYSKSNNSGFAWDWLVAGGCHIPVYQEMVVFEPEMGYLVKKLQIDDSTTTRVSAPFAGLRISANFCGSYCWEAFFDYLFAGVRQQNGQYINNQNGLTVNLPEVHGHGVRNAYQVGSSFKYMPWEHWVFTLDWQLFHAQSKFKAVPYGILNTLNESLNEWMSNQIEVMARYNF